MAMSVRRLAAALAALAALSWLAVIQAARFGAAAHRMTDADLSLDLPRANWSSPARAYRDYYASEAARDFCAAHGYPVFAPRPDGGERKVYDLTMVNTELDFLEIRLETLYDAVDYFVVVESPRTFQGGPKQLVLRDNWQRFARFHDKMVHHVLEFPPGFAPRLTWDYEDLQRDAAVVQALPRLAGRAAPVPGDVLVVADVDEIPRPATVLLLRTCRFPRRLTLASRFYYYAFQFRHAGAEWPHPQATVYDGPERTLRPTALRAGIGGGALRRALDSATLANAAWHCSSCFGTVAALLNKMASFSHPWMNEAQFRDRDRIAAAVRAGRDVWGRRRDVLERVEANADVPPVLRAAAGRRRFGYMLSRDGESAGFADYP